jgi:phage terminase small subunit
MKKFDKDTPAGLSLTAAAWWHSVTSNYALEDHHKKILECACRAWDRAAQAAALVDAEGLVTYDRFQQAKVHPACLVERDNRALFARLVRELGLDLDSPEERRAPVTVGRGRRR